MNCVCLVSLGIGSFRFWLKDTGRCCMLLCGWWYNPLRFWSLKRVIANMTTTFDTVFDNYRIKVRPAFGLRKWIRFHRWYLPFMDNDKIPLTATISCIGKKRIDENIQYSWLFRRLKDDKTFGSGVGQIRLGERISVVSDLIWESGKYSLDFVLVENGISYRKSNIMVIPVADRADVTLTFIPIFMSVILSVSALVLSIIALIER